MRVLLSMPNDGQTNNYIINALQDNGCDVFMTDHRAGLESCMKLFPELMKFFKPDLFLCLHLVRGQTYHPAFIDDMRARFPSVRYAAWILDAIIHGKKAYEDKTFAEIISAYDYLFTVDKYNVDKFDHKNVYYLPEGYCKFSHLPIQSKDKKYDISFIGQFGNSEVHTDRIDLLDRICSLYPQTIIFGNAMNMTPAINSCYKRRTTINDIEHSRICSQSKINICNSGWPDLMPSARNYRVSASGGFMLANRGKAHADLWEEGKEIVFCDNHKDCIQKIKYYLSHEDERDKIAKAGHRKTTKNYCFSNIVKDMLRVVGYAS